MSYSRPLLTVNDLARYLSISRRSVYLLVERGELPSFRVGERIRFKPDEVDAYLASRRSPSEPHGTLRHTTDKASPAQD